MSDRIDKLGYQIHPFDRVIKSLKESNIVLKFYLYPQQLYKQIIHSRDNSILELPDKIIHLENFIQDQKEQLSEKDQIIRINRRIKSAGISGNLDALYGTELEIISSANLPTNMLENPDVSQGSEQLCSVSTGTNMRINCFWTRKPMEEKRIQFERHQRE